MFISAFGRFNGPPGLHSRLAQASMRRACMPDLDNQNQRPPEGPRCRTILSMYCC